MLPTPDVSLEELGGGENRPLTILFVDVSGSFKSTGSMSGEECASFMTPVLAILIDTIVAHGGRVGRCLGDGLLAYFGTPRVREDDCDRAILATLAIQHALRRRGFEITAGLHYGTVYLGWIGSHQYRELTVMGAIVDIAARLQSKAAPGQLLASDAVIKRTRKRHGFTPVSLLLKGSSEPVLAHVCSREDTTRPPGEPVLSAPAQASARGEKRGLERQVPDDVFGLVVARRDELAKAEREALELASILGGPFHPSVLSRVAGKDLAAPLEALARAGWLRHSSARSDCYLFPGWQQRAAIYQTLLQSTRQALHRRIAAALETLDGTHRTARRRATFHRNRA